VEERNLDVGESTVARETEELDICVNVDEETNVRAEADPPQGVPCFSEDDYELTVVVSPTSPPTDPPSPSPSDPPSPSPTVIGQCIVEVDITCEDDNGTDCDEIPTPIKQCDTSDVITFTYTAETCDESFNSQDDTCEDIGTGPSDSATIECRDSSFVVLSVNTVTVGDTFTVALGNAPDTDSISCAILSDSILKQTLVVDTTMLTLKDKFGSLQLESCDEQSCLVPITYTYDIRNIGDTPMEVTSVTRTRGTSTVDLIGIVEERNLDVGESTVARETEELDVCVNVDEETSVRVEADPPIGDPCFSVDDYELTVVVSPTSPPTDPPSPSPSDPPSPSPSFIDDPKRCNVGVNVSCTPRGGSEDCGSIVVARTRCNQRPVAMVFKYNGGTCDQSDNIQPPTLFQCFDFFGGPPTTSGETSYILVTDIKGGSIVYHEGTVAVGDEYTVADRPFEVDANMNITIYRNGNIVAENLLQTLVYHSSCSQNLFLKDRYGASQLVIFVNNLQGVQTCFFNATYTISLENSFNTVGSGSSASLTTLLGNIELGNQIIPFDFSDDISGTVLQPDTVYDGTPLKLDVVIDLTVISNNQVSTFITAISPSGFVCSDIDTLNFVSGLAPPPNIPTRSPTSIPTRSPAPTPDPEETACALSPGILCRVLNGGGLLTCDNIVPPPNQECTSGVPISELDFIYRGGGCTNNVLNCVGGAANTDQVWITIESAAQNILWNQLTERDTFMSLRGIDNQMEVTISTVQNNRPGTELLRYDILTNCTATAGLTLKDRYGALELAEFTIRDGDIVVANAAYADVLIEYDIELEDNTAIKAQITSARSTGGLVSNQITETFTPPAEPIGRKTRYILGTESYFIDLIDGGIDQEYAFELEVIANSASNVNLPCNATTAFGFFAN